jgi:HEAT repeat protein
LKLSVIMSQESDCRNDSRTTEELVDFALCQSDEDSAWSAVTSLHWRGTFEVLKQAEQLTRSSSSRERRLGADILGQLGVPERSFPAECTEILSGMLCSDDEPEVLRSVLVAMSFHDCGPALPLIASFSGHSDASVRHATVLALAAEESQFAVTHLITLSGDADDNVRDWATFALGTLFEMDTPGIRDALFQRIEDANDEVRGEALVGLACRKDSRVINALKTELATDCVGRLAIEASEMIASPELSPHLVKLQSWWDVDPCLLERAIVACS